MRRAFLLLATLAAAAALRLPSSPLPPSPRASSPRMDAISDVAALLGMTDPDEKKAVVKRLSEERGLDPTGRIEELVSQNKVMLFVKGTAFAVRLQQHRRAAGRDCRRHQDLRRALRRDRPRGHQGVFELADDPQIYLGGEFIGGADIAIEMHESGELKDMSPRRWRRRSRAAKTSQSGISRRTTSRVESWRFSVCKILWLGSYIRPSQDYTASRG